MKASDQSDKKCLILKPSSIYSVASILSVATVIFYLFEILK